MKNNNRNNLGDLPSLDNLLKLECLAQNKGSGVGFEDLIGIWKFESVWKQGSSKDNIFVNSLLKTFSANLELSHQKNISPHKTFNLSNSIRFGLLCIRFIGRGQLEGKQPVLKFYFSQIELKLASKILISRTLELPEKNSYPFFLLIGMDIDKNWLSARGRGGGLALWVKQKPQKFI